MFEKLESIKECEELNKTVSNHQRIIEIQEQL